MLEIKRVQCKEQLALAEANSAKRDREQSRLEVNKLKEQIATMKTDRDTFEAKVIETLQRTRETLQRTQVSSKVLLHEVHELEEVLCHSLDHQIMVRKAADLRAEEVLCQQHSETIEELVVRIRSAYSGELTWQNSIYMRMVSQSEIRE